MRTRPTRLSPRLLILCLLPLLACGGGSDVGEPGSAGPEIGGEPLELRGTNWNGDEFRLSDLRGRVPLVFFGYTYCPDVCPMTLAKLKQLYTDLGEPPELAIVFASVDPHRDSVEKLAGYVPGFDRRFYGVHLDFDELDAAQESFGLTVQYGQPKDGPGTDSYYYVDHTGSYFLLDRDGRLRLRFPPTARAAELRTEVESLLSERTTSLPAPAATTPAAVSTAAARLLVEGAEARVLPDVAAVYLRVVNRGTEADRLVGVETESAAHAMLHETREEEGVMRMTHQEEGFEVPAGGTLELAPGGRHIMLHGLDVGEATSVPLTLNFTAAGAIEIEAPIVERLGSSAGGDDT